jgi:excisionase family DNA binding protein
MSDDGLTVDQAAQLAGVSAKTIRRAIAKGDLIAVTVKGRHGGYRIPREAVEALYQNAPTTRPVSPVQELATEIAELRGQLDRITQQLDESNREAAQLRAEVHDSRAQLAQFQDHILKALPPPPRPGLFARLRGKKG